MKCHALSGKTGAELAAAVETFGKQNADVWYACYAIDAKGAHHALVFYGPDQVRADRSTVATDADRFISDALSDGRRSGRSSG